MTAPIRIGTRGSALAIAQARLAAEALAAIGQPAELVMIETAGDKRAADTPWGEGAFVGAIEQALREGRVDVAVHSAKDMPTATDQGLAVIAYLPRADARDALVTVADGRRATLDELPPGASIGTDSPRRTGFLRARRPDLSVRPLHGNVDTRLRRLDAGEVDALVLAAAGLDRLDRGDRISQRFAPSELPPAPGQGAIAIQARAEDGRLAQVGRLVDDGPTRTAVEAERTFLAATGGGCRAPVGALATVANGRLSLLAGFATIDGRASAIERIEGPLEDAQRLAGRLAEGLVARRMALAGERSVLLTRPPADSARLSARLAEHGLRSVTVPAIEIRRRTDDGTLAAELRRLPDYDWAVVSSPNGARAVADAAADAAIDVASGRWAAVGAATTAALSLPQGHAAWQPSAARAEVLAEELPLRPGAAVLVVRGDLADESLLDRLRDRGARVQAVVAYETIEAPPASRPLLAEALASDPVAVVLASPSAVRGLLALAADDAARNRLLALTAVCVGPVTGAAARAAGFGRVVESATPDASSVAETVAGLPVGRSAPAGVAS